MFTTSSSSSSLFVKVTLLQHTYMYIYNKQNNDTYNGESNEGKVHLQNMC